MTTVQRTVTILFLRRPGELLLAMKKRGFGEGKWNGVGGKVEPGETPLQAAVREAEEEIDVTPVRARQVGRLHFTLHTGTDQLVHDCHIFMAHQWKGEPAETEEMRPRWFADTQIPYDAMWADDRLWLPILLNGDSFEGSATFDGETMTGHNIRKVRALTQAPDVQ